MEKIRIGIDLGTTNTLACYMKGSKPDIVKFPGGKMLPSVLYLDENGTVLVGEMARKKSILDPLNSIRSSKTEMGNFNKKWTLRDREFTPTDVATEILKEVKRGVLKRTKSEEGTEVEAVITVPAYFTSNQIDETKKAGERAGLNVLGIITEPRAAAIANIKELGVSEQKIFVVDLGGGTFDISVLKASKDQYSTVAVDGDRHLGGDDFDNLLFDYFRHLIEDDLGIDLSSQEASGLEYNEYYSMLGRVKEEACQAKVELSEEEEYDSNLPNLFPYKGSSYNFSYVIDRKSFYGLCEELFQKIQQRILKVFEDNTKLKIEEIDSVILAGGSCYIPRVKEDVERIFAKSADTTMDRSTMVVIGACFIADTWDDLSGGGNDIISHSLGVEAMGEDGKLVLAKLLYRSAEYPCSQSRIFTTSADNQESVTITIYEAGSDKEDIEEIEARGENGETVSVHDLYGSFELTGIQEAKKGVPQINVTFEYDRSRLLTVTAQDLVTNASKRIKVEKGMQAKPSAHIEPVDFELLIDVSGSMRGDPLNQAVKAATKLICEIIDLRVHSLGIISFGDYVEEIHSLSQNRDSLIRSLGQLEAYGGTFMEKAIQLGASTLLEREGQKHKVLMIVTDGAPNSREATKQEANGAKNRGIDIITIAAGEGADSGYLSQLATERNFAFSISNMGQLGEIFKTAVAQYLAVAGSR